MKEYIPKLGIGIGLRPVHYEEIFSYNPAIDWFEIISENYMVKGGKPLENLERILERYPVVQHGVNLAIGSPDPLDWDYLKQLKALTRRTKTPWLSDHLCWGRLPGAHFHDLLPLPYTQEVVKYVSERARIVQDYLEIPFALENLSSYVAFNEDEMAEWEFYTAVVEKADIYMMLDVNNIYVSSRNHGFDPLEYIDYIPMQRVIQIHLAGHSDHGDYVLDTHDHPVRDEVWELYAEVWPRTGGVSTLLEWDENFVSFEETWKEALRAKAFQKELTLA
ncbi:MAG: DUF692 domain-containing protein [Chlamydiales bacterium]|nr:DUF692 domain-containing protein [Chlamydiales bacterium]